MSITTPAGKVVFLMETSVDISRKNPRDQLKTIEKQEIAFCENKGYRNRNYSLSFSSFFEVFIFIEKE